MMMADSSLLPVPDIVRSAYATLVVTDMAEARRFWVDLLGFVVTYEDSCALYLRGYDELTHHNLIVRSGPAAAAGALGYRVRSADDLAKAEVYYAALGCRTAWYSEASPVLDLDGKLRPVTELAQISEVRVGTDGFTAPAE